jgi:hypothetical protein
MMSTAGESRMSSVSGLKESPSTATTLPFALPPSAPSIFSSMTSRCRSFTRITASTISSARPFSWAKCAMERVSLGKHEPPKPGPGCRNLEPMRRSRPMPRAMSWTSAPIASLRFAISLMNEIFVAR